MQAQGIPVFPVNSEFHIGFLPFKVRITFQGTACDDGKPLAHE
jgi:hypothetical protein